MEKILDALLGRTFKASKFLHVVSLAMTHIASKKDQKWGGPATPFLGKGWLQPPRDFLFYFLFPSFFQKKKKNGVVLGILGFSFVLFFLKEGNKIK
jgi:hypothetical protein